MYAKTHKTQLLLITVTNANCKCHTMYLMLRSELSLVAHRFLKLWICGGNWTFHPFISSHLDVSSLDKFHLSCLFS